MTEGGFTAARAELVVRSALSWSARDPAREPGAGLFGGAGRRVVLTEAGRALVSRARAPLAEAEAETARHTVAAVAGPATGRGAVGTVQTLTCVGLPAELSDFHRRLPGIQVPVRDAPVAELVRALRAGEPDLACPAPDARELPEGLTAYVARHEELVPATGPGHPLAAAGRTPARGPRRCGQGSGRRSCPGPSGSRSGPGCRACGYGGPSPEPGRTVVPAGRGPRPRNPAAAARPAHLTGAAPAAAGRPGGRRPPAG
ncbi:LysR substrate-binding domain-containing protein [Streptomyces sp. NPDC058319]|uniref:LysR substrate-binding domain-containing protein n=1 Tax=unclassified Streptomyces TaxID=2593676 RepID=UPI0036E0A722